MREDAGKADGADPRKSCKHMNELGLHSEAGAGQGCHKSFKLHCCTKYHPNLTGLSPVLGTAVFHTHHVDTTW